MPTLSVVARNNHFLTGQLFGGLSHTVDAIPDQLHAVADPSNHTNIDASAQTQKLRRNEDKIANQAASSSSSVAPHPSVAQTSSSAHVHYSCSSRAAPRMCCQLLADRPAAISLQDPAASPATKPPPPPAVTYALIVGMISNGVTQWSHRTHGLRALIGGAQPYPWLVGPCGSAI